MGLFDAFKRKKTDSDATSESVVQTDGVESVGKVEGTVSSEETKKEGAGFLSRAFGTMLKAVGIGGWKAKQIEDLQPNFTSEDPLDHVLELNKASTAFRGLKNLGIYADITKITFSHAIKLTTEDDFVEISTEDLEAVGNNLPSDDSSDNPLDFTFDDLLERDCPDLGKTRKPDSVIPYSA